MSHPGGEVAKPDIKFDMRWEITQPIEVEMERWLKYMASSWCSQANRFYWSRRKQEAAQAYADAYQTALDHLRKELEMFPVSKRWKADS